MTWKRAEHRAEKGRKKAGDIETGGGKRWKIAAKKAIFWDSN